MGRVFSLVSQSRASSGLRVGPDSFHILRRRSRFAEAEPQPRANDGWLAENQFCTLLSIESRSVVVDLTISSPRCCSKAFIFLPLGFLTTLPRFPSIPYQKAMTGQSGMTCTKYKYSTGSSRSSTSALHIEFLRALRTRTEAGWGRGDVLRRGNC